MIATDILIKLNTCQGKGDYTDTYCVYAADWFPVGYLDTKYRQVKEIIKNNLEKKYCEPMEDFKLRYIPLTVFHNGELKPENIVQALLDRDLIKPLKNIKGVYAATETLKKELEENRRQRQLKFIIRTNRVMMGSSKWERLENKNNEGLITLASSIERFSSIGKRVLV